MVRQALTAAVKGEEYEPENPDKDKLDEKCGCFVTLKTNGQLRGCLGCFTSESPLWRTAPAYARYSALEDPRFAGRRIQPEELPEVEVSISILSPLKPCPAPEDIRLGVDGIYVQGQGGRSGCFLPSVARETGWNVEEFWGHCCRDKAGLQWDSWRQPDVALYTFTASEVDA